MSLIKRAFTSSSRLLTTPPVTAATSTKPLLTLYTGPNCGLCEIKKNDIQSLRWDHDFDFEIYNLAEPPAEVDPDAHAKLRRRYLRDIPILHFNGQPFSKHRLDKEQLVKALKDFDNASATRNPKHE